MNKIALVTGASSGFGQKMVEDLLARNWQVIASFRQAHERPEVLAQERQKYPQKLRIVSLDVTRPEEREALLKLLESEYGGRLDLLVNNAGYGLYGALEDLSEDQIRAQMETNFFGPMLLTRLLLPCLKRTQGRLITITSIMGRYSMPLVGLYSASKYALEGLHEALYYELHSQGIQVCTIQPGGFRTRFLASVTWGANSREQNSAYYQMGQNFQAFMDRLTSRPKAPGPERVSQAVMKVLQRPQMPRCVVVGKDATALAALQRGPRKIYQAFIRKMSAQIFGR